MVHRILIPSCIAALLLFASACRPDREEKRAASLGEKAESVALSTDQIDKTSPTVKEGAKAAFGRSVNTIFGIKLPTGMSPAPGPMKVYRFEGKQPLSQVVYLIKKQVMFESEKREGEGYLLRRAKARKDPHDKALAIRMFATETGSTIDVWQERNYKDKLPERASRVVLGGRKRQKQKPITDDKARKAERREKMTHAMRIMRKLEKRVPLTEEEKQSELFH